MGNSMPLVAPARFHVGAALLFFDTTLYAAACRFGLAARSRAFEGAQHERNHFSSGIVEVQPLVARPLAGHQKPAIRIEGSGCDRSQATARAFVEPGDARQVDPKLDLACHLVHILSAGPTRTDRVH